MGFHDYISENEAANIVGVSLNTLKRFSEAGYLKVETDSDGLNLFSKSELSSVFGITTSPSTKNNDKTLTPSLDKAIEKITVDEPALMEVAGDNDSPTNAVPEKHEEPVYWAETINAGEDINVEDTASEESPLTNTEKSVEIPLQEEIKVQSTYRPETSAIHANRDFSALKIENNKLKSISEMQERILEMREQEIADLKKERDWMKIRIERHEEKSDRDQLLLLSETQMLRNVLMMQNQKRISPLRNALVWLGFAEEKEDKSVNFASKDIIQHSDKPK